MNLTQYHQPYSHKSESKIGILVVHGLTSTTSSMKFMAESFANADFNVELPQLAGHGTKWQDLNKVSCQDWVDCLEIALQTLQKRASKIFICGLSLGGGLSLFLANNHPEISGLILINNICVFTNPKYWFVPLLHHIIPAVPAVASDIKDPNEKEIAYDRTPTKAVYEMLKMLKIIRKSLPNIKQPTLIFKSKEDHVIPQKSAIFTLNNIGSKDKNLIWLNNSYHVATLDFDKELVASKSIEFIEKLR